LLTIFVGDKFAATNALANHKFGL